MFVFSIYFYTLMMNLPKTIGQNEPFCMLTICVYIQMWASLNSGRMIFHWQNSYCRNLKEHRNHKAVLFHDFECNSRFIS